MAQQPEWSDLKVAVERGMDVRPMSSTCVCGDSHTGHQRAIAKDDGWLVQCLSCEYAWVEYRLSDARRER